MPALCDQQEFTLYGTSACHLCELAEDLLERLDAASQSLQWCKVDISESDELFQRYGVRIPVLRAPSGDELGWPFNADQLRAFVDGLPGD